MPPDTRDALTPDGLIRDVVTRHVLALDPAETAETAEHIVVALPRLIGRDLGRRGAVVGVSGGVDSAVCLALAARALGPERVHALLMPEADSDPDAGKRAAALCEQLNVAYDVEDIGPALEALGCYRRRDDAIRRLFPDYGPGWRQKIALSSGRLDRDRAGHFELTVAPPGSDGTETPPGHETPRSETKRMPVDVYLQIVAATNMKQRTRKLLEQHHAEARNYAVLGTPNRLEYELGFFVKNGDGAADLKPIAHLYKSQVYALARHLGIPEEIQRRPPTTDTYSLAQTQEEFYFGLPLARMDLALHARTHGVPPADAAPALGLTPEQVERVYAAIDRKRQAARRLHLAPLLVEAGEDAP